jgi:hypothetical protein
MELILAANRALAEDVGLIFTFFVLMGGVVGVLLAYIAVQIRGERAQNRKYETSGRGSASATER